MLHSNTACHDHGERQESEEDKKIRYESIKKAREDLLKENLKAALRSFFIKELYSSTDDLFDTAFKVDRVGLAVRALDELAAELKRERKP